MPRRRLLDPSFTDNVEVAKLSSYERLFVIGCLRNADDEGRLIAHPSYLKSEIFMYDDDIDLSRMKDIRESALLKMASWHQDNVWRLVLYQNGEQEYIYFPNWYEFNKPSHPTQSKIPSPTQEPDSRSNPELVQNDSIQLPESLATDSALSQVKSSQVKLSQVKGVQEDFGSVLDSEEDLTDLLTTTLTENMPRGAVACMPVVDKLWAAAGRKMKSAVFDVWFQAMKEYPARVVAVALAKSVKYAGNAQNEANYTLKILQEQMGKHQRDPPH